MGTQIRAVLSAGAIAVCVGFAASACSSGSTAGVESASSSASASPAFPVESLPPGVQKDSVFDLNSTKDMTGVVSTVPFGQSPYAAHLPDVCAFVPSSLIQQFGLSTKRKGYKGTQLVVQTCTMQNLSRGGLPASSVTISFFTNNIEEISDPSKSSVVTPRVAISDRVNGSVRKPVPSNLADIQTCDVDWGTFFGAVIVSFRSLESPPPDLCARALDAARLFAPHVPKSPSQMRPS
ncbi:MAG: hypothetical protein PGN29_08745 [Gordonia paraffinivorans]